MPVQGVGDALSIECPRCGIYLISEEAAHDMNGYHRGVPERIARIGHRVRRLQQGTRPPYVTGDLVERFLEQPLPGIMEQSNLLVSWLGTRTLPGKTEWVQAHTHQFVIGAASAEGFGFIVDHLVSTGNLEVKMSEAIGAPRRSDTNHHLSVIWDAQTLPLAAEQLKATIRATLPDEAKLQD